jgi:multiple sugar transport system substrate-binding protein
VDDKDKQTLSQKVFSTEVSRKRFLQLTAGLGVTAAGLVTFAGQCGGETAAPTATTAPAGAPTTVATTGPSEAPTSGPAAPTVAPSSQGLASGMIGGPTGFEGAGRYQYPEDSQEGRAIAGIKALKDKPAKLTFMLAEGSVGHFTTPFPDMPPYPKGAPTPAEVWEKETGIALDWASSPGDQLYTKAQQENATKSGQFDAMCIFLQNVGDLVEGGLAVNMDECVAKYKPEWDDPKWGFVGGAPTTGAVQKYKGSNYLVNLDGDWQVWLYRKDMIDDPAEQKAFKDKYGWDLQWPDTWDQATQVFEFFNRPDKGLLGATDLRNQYWGYVNWQMYFAGSASPFQLYWDKNGKALINNEAGVAAAKYYCDSMKWHSTDGVTWGWTEQLQNFADGGAFATSSFAACAKNSGPGNPKSAVSKEGMRGAALQPGYNVGGKIVKRPMYWAGNCFLVSSSSKNQEAAYLFLQWASGGRMYPYITANPAGFFDFCHVSDMTDPLSVNAYGQFLADEWPDIIKHSIPPIKAAGSNEYANALDTELLSALSGSKTPEQAMNDAANTWDSITERIGAEKIVAEMEAEAKEWSTVLDDPKIKTA